MCVCVCVCVCVHGHTHLGAQAVKALMVLTVSVVMGLFSRQTLRGSLFFSGRRTVVSYSKLLINSSFFQCNTGTVCCVCVCVCAHECTLCVHVC